MFELPEDYLLYYESKHRNKAMSAAGVMIDAHREENYRGGTVDFWAGLVRRVLAKQKVIAVKEQLEVKAKNDADLRLLVGSKQIGSKSYGYLVGLAATRKDVYVFEAWGPAGEFGQDRSKLEKAFESMRIR